MRQSEVPFELEGLYSEARTKLPTAKNQQICNTRLYILKTKGDLIRRSAQPSGGLGASAGDASTLDSNNERVQYIPE